MYQIGQYIMYGSIGVCRVKDIADGAAIGLEDGRYYVLDPLYESGTIYTPADAPKVFMRPVITRDEAEALIDSIPSLEAEPDHTRNLQELCAHYKAATESHDCTHLLALTKSIRAKRRQQQRHGRKLGQVDEKFMKQAETCLFGEFAVALGMDIAEVPDYIDQRIASGPIS